MSEAILVPSLYRPTYQLERRIQRLRALKTMYEHKLAVIEAELQELEALRFTLE